jgi:hypothetical protein
MRSAGELSLPARACSAMGKVVVSCVGRRTPDHAVAQRPFASRRSSFEALAVPATNPVARQRLGGVARLGLRPLVVLFRERPHHGGGTRQACQGGCNVSELGRAAPLPPTQEPAGPKDSVVEQAGQRKSNKAFTCSSAGMVASVLLDACAPCTCTRKRGRTSQPQPPEE